MGAGYSENSNLTEYDHNGALLRIVNSSAVNHWKNAPPCDLPALPYATICWREILHWYDTQFPTRRDKRFPGDSVMNADIRQVFSRLEHGDRLSGLLGIMPENIELILRARSARMHESNRRIFNKLTLKMISSMRRLLIETATRIATHWINDSNLWISIFWKF